MENSCKTAVGFFFVVLAGALLSAIVGGTFGAAVAVVSPEFVSGLFNRSEPGVVRYAFAVGMIWGVFIAAAVSGFACFLAALIKILRIRFDNKRQQADEAR